MKTTKLLLIYILIYLPITINGQIKKIGTPLIKNYNRIEYKGGTQNWDIDQDKNGNMYFANNTGLIQFDGSTWKKYKAKKTDEMKCLKVDPTGKVYVGYYNEFGYFKANSKGKLEYFSLSSLLNKKEHSKMDVVWKIHLYKDEVIFQSFHSIYIYKNNKLKIINAPKKFQFSFISNGRLYIQDIFSGIMEYHDGKLTYLKGTNALNNTEVWGVIEIQKNKILISTLDRGIFTLSNNQVIPWNTQANTFIKKNGSLGCILYKNKYIVINSVLDGIIVCDLNGNIIQHINRSKGLQNNTALSLFIDNSNNLWLGLDNGITYVNENSLLTYLDFNYNLGTVYSSVIHKGNLYVATNQGVFYHPWNTDFKADSFKLVEGTTTIAWNIQIMNGELICASNKGALVILDGKLIKNLDPTGYLKFEPIPKHPGFYIGANYNGFSIFEKTNTGIKLRNKVKGFNKSSIVFEIDNNYIWLKKDEFIYKISLENNLRKTQIIKTYTQFSESNPGIGSLQKINNKIYFQTNNIFYTYSKIQNTFIEDQAITNLFKSIPKINQLIEDSNGNLWYNNNNSMGVLMKAGNKYRHISSPLSNLTENLVTNYMSINTIDSKNTFIGLTDGLAHYDSTIENITPLKPKALIRSFSFPGDTIHLGNGQNKEEEYELPYSSNQVKFTFSSPSYENLENLEFSYQLEGFEENWSVWSNSTVKEYTNLKEGNYKMKVRVKNNSGIESDEASIAFRVYPPWYRHSLAYLLYLLMAAGCVHYIRFRIRMKIRKNKHFETLEQRRLYLEKETKIKQEQYELEKEIEKLENEKLQIKILSKDKELVNNTLQVVKKNKILNGIIQKLKDINTGSFDETTKAQFAKLNRSITKEVNTDKSWKDLEKHLKNVHFDFLKKLKEKHPTISSREMDLATYLLMNMSTKEIAEFMNISTGGVELARYRLRKKLELNQKENLIGYLMSIK
ncbi:triple tyrosine motif-containing protein [Flavobacterium granuli]|uniref:Ligand-binding sensor domain-containing protein/DNA-binding CsgD family transcriptional regulator n=1 Tax=Flavobacterium granuli TaxID=280093 RepID=A0ABU1S5Q2_9FLAO|nr:triple tyrosine motif-containing protein [Flavobacterium granuli]MDR6846252.1 ligand-binding sensor domain-containing protein/DNA-binding CsgD family transcriptional regulator [Flavobacterium granuli]